MDEVSAVAVEVAVVEPVAVAVAGAKGAFGSAIESDQAVACRTHPKVSRTAGENQSALKTEYGCALEQLALELALAPAPVLGTEHEHEHEQLAPGLELQLALEPGLGPGLVGPGLVEIARGFEQRASGGW